MLGVGVGLGLFMWRVIGSRIDRVQSKIEDLAKDHQTLAKEFSELRGEIRARLGTTPAE